MQLPWRLKQSCQSCLNPLASSLGAFALNWTTPIRVLEDKQLTQYPRQLAHPNGDFCYVTPPPLLQVLCCHPRQPVTEMGGCHPSPALPCPPNPGLGLAAFRTSHSIGWVSLVAQAETRSGRVQNIFFVDFYCPSLCRCFSMIHSSQ